MTAREVIKLFPTEEVLTAAFNAMCKHFEVCRSQPQRARLQSGRMALEWVIEDARSGGINLDADYIFADSVSDIRVREFIRVFLDLPEKERDTFIITELL